MTDNEKYICDMTKSLDWEVSIHRSPANWANGKIFMELNYSHDGQHITVCMDPHQAEKIAFLLHHASIKLREELEQL